MSQSSVRPVVLIIRDGWGHNPHAQWNHANAVHLAETPVNDLLLKDYPSVQIHTSGEDVGLPQGVMGNSEVGHQNIGAGRIVNQEVMRITSTIRDGSFFTNPVFLGALEHAQKHNSSLHILGLFSDGRVHSDMQHAFALVDLCKQQGFDGKRLFVHAITDGRDTSPNSGLGFVEQLEGKLAEAGVGRVAGVVGRYYAMDRDNRWDRVEQAYNLLTRGSQRVFQSSLDAIAHYYDNASEASRGGDEFILPSSIAPDGEIDPAQRIKPGDAVIFFNYRGDRPRELCKAFMLDEASWQLMPNGGFDRGRRLENLYFVGMTGYERGLPIRVAFDKPPKLEGILGGYVSQLDLAQFRCAETEKFPHVTFFFNDYREEPFEREDRQIIPSPRDVTTYDQKPEMSAHGVTEEMLRRIDSGVYDLMVLNYANGDMVGHTGVLKAAVRACETVDECVGKVVRAVRAKGGSLIVTADHGNAEQMIDPATKGPHTAHTTYDVDLIVVDDRVKGNQLRTGGRLADIAPTLLSMMGLEQPGAMSGQSLLPPGAL